MEDKAREELNERIVEANALMVAIVDRVAMLHPIYQGVAAELSESAKGLVGWHVLSILNVYKELSIYLKGRKQPKFVNKKHYAVKRTWTNWGWNRLLGKATTMQFNFEVTGDEGTLKHNYAEPFKGISEEQIEMIATVLYGWGKEEENEFEG